MKRAWIALAVAMAVVLPVRLVEFFQFSDFQTGFYTDKGRTAAIASVLLLASLIVLMVFGYRGTENGAAVPTVKHAGTAALAALTGVIIAGQSLVGLFFTESAETQVLDRIFSAAGLLAAVTFLTAAYDFATGETILQKRSLLAIFPSVWGCLCLISMFVSYAALANRLENLYHTLTVSFLLLFLFSQAKLLVGLETEKSGRNVFLFGFPAAAMALSTSVPNCISYFSGLGAMGNFPVGLHMVNLVMAVYILVFLSAVSRTADTAMAYVAPASDGSEEPSKAEAEPEQGSAEESKSISENQVAAGPKNNLGDSENSQDALLECAVFLKKSYCGEEKFVEMGEKAIPTRKRTEG
jgi:hypothetical protein